MTDKEIVLKALAVAQGNGLKLPHPFSDSSFWQDWRYNHTKPPLNLIGFLYSHEFAKAFWGEDIIVLDFADGYNHYAFGGSLSYPYDEAAAIQYVAEKWKYHLQEMALDEDPIKYLKKFL